jgi:nuclear pore complex protein Nup62
LIILIIFSSTAGGTSLAGGDSKPGRQMTYKQLEEETNKWMAELEEQERNFLVQATQVNAWDRMVIDNGEKVLGHNRVFSSEYRGASAPA